MLGIPWPDSDAEDEPKDGHFFLGAFEEVRMANKELRLSGHTLRTYFPPKGSTTSTMPAEINGFNPIQRVFDAGFGRKLVITAKGYFGQARTPAQRGNVVCILLGCSVPVILRKQANGQSHKVISEAYIHGVSEGEAMDWLEAGHHSLEDIRII